MPLARYHGVAYVVGSDGESTEIAPLASVAVRREDTGALASLFSDRDGSVGIANPITADSYGRFAFHAAGLEDGYRLIVTEAGSPGLEYTFRYVPVGTIAEYDNPLTTKGDIIVRTGGTADTPTRKAVGSDGYVLVPSSTAADGLAWAPPGLGFNLVGGYLDWSTAGSPASTLVVAIKTWSGADPSASEPVFIAFRSATAGTGSLTYRKIVAATSITIDDTALLGTRSGVPFRLWCVAFDDGGTIRLAIINCVTTVASPGSGSDVTAIYPLAGWGIASATQEGNTSDSAQVFYSDGAAVSSKAYATLGYASWEAGLANAGNWNSDPTREQLFGPGGALPGQQIQVARNDTGVVATGSTATPADNTIPLIGEGDQYMAQAITPSSAANILRCKAQGTFAHSTNSTFMVALHQDAISNALKSLSEDTAGTGRMSSVLIDHLMLAATSSATTLRLRAGGAAGTTTTFNGAGGAQLMGGSLNSFIEVTEMMG